jgi:hypothetical protein
MIKQWVSKTIRFIATTFFPVYLRGVVKTFIIFNRDFGYFKSSKKGTSMDRDGNPIPWLTYPTIEYLQQLDLSDKTIFEYGAGSSTLFWAKRAKQVITVENDPEWYRRISSLVPENVKLILVENKEDYSRAIYRFPEKFDIILVDGFAGFPRYDCAVAALAQLASDGFIILDNSEWHEETSRLLREADLLEVDMAGFSPTNRYTSTTSFYFRRTVNLKPKYARQPIHNIGSVHRTEANPGFWEEFRIL